MKLEPQGKFDNLNLPQSKELRIEQMSRDSKILRKIGGKEITEYKFNEDEDRWAVIGER